MCAKTGLHGARAGAVTLRHRSLHMKLGESGAARPALPELEERRRAEMRSCGESGPALEPGQARVQPSLPTLPDSPAAPAARDAHWRDRVAGAERAFWGAVCLETASHHVKHA